MSQAEGGAMSQAVGELLQEVKRAQLELEAQQPQKSGSTGFSEAMAAREATASQGVHASGDPRAISVILQARLRTQVGQTEKRQESALWTMMRDLVNGQDKMTEIMNKCLSGHQYSPPDLLAVQAAVYRYSQELDLSTKVVEKASSAVKQTFNTQV